MAASASTPQQGGGPSRSGGRFLGFLYFMLVVLVTLITTTNLVTDYARTRADLEQRVTAYAQSMATDIRWYLEVAWQTLDRTAAALKSLTDKAEITAAVETSQAELPEGVSILVYDANGHAIAGSHYDGTPIEILDRHYFQELKDGKEEVISHLLTDRMTGAATFAVARALHAEDGSFAGAIATYAPMPLLSAAWLSIGGTNSNAFIVHEDGWLTGRMPPVPTDIYDNPVSQEFVSNFTRAERGVYWAPVSPIDGIDRVLGYAKTAGSPLIAVVGIDPESYFADFWHRVLITIATLLPVLLFLGVATRRSQAIMRRQEETARQLGISHARNETLLLEIHHRVKNNLQTVMALVRSQVKDPAILNEISPRISAMSAVHEHIYRNVDFLETAAPDYLTDIAQKVIYAAGRDLRLRTDIEDITLPGAAMMPLGQLVNEAITNAIKYGYADGRQGTISITLRREENSRARLTIHNDGDPPVDHQEQGLGRRLMTSFAAQLQGEVETLSDADGVSVILRFPVPKA